MSIHWQRPKHKGVTYNSYYTLESWYLDQDGNVAAAAAAAAIPASFPGLAPMSPSWSFNILQSETTQMACPAGWKLY